MNRGPENDENRFEIDRLVLLIKSTAINRTARTRDYRRIYLSIYQLINLLICRMRRIRGALLRPSRYISRKISRARMCARERERERETARGRMALRK